jgi:hypothetical protein
MQRTAQLPPLGLFCAWVSMLLHSIMLAVGHGLGAGCHYVVYHPVDRVIRAA